MKRQLGVTLVELMISMLLGLLIAIGLATLFSQNKRSFYQNEDLARMLEDGRYGLQEIARDISMTGFYAELVSPSDWTVHTSLNGAADCRAADATTITPGNPGLLVSDDPFRVSWTYAVFPRSNESFNAAQAALAVADWPTVADAASEFPCLAGLDVQPGSDVFYSKRVAGASTDAPAAGRVYLARRLSDPGLYPAGSLPAKPVGAPLEDDWEYQPRVYYVRNMPVDIDLDGAADLDVPTLCRMVLNPGPAFQEDCIAQGVERFQIEWGVDTDRDGDANAYVSTLDETLQNAALADANEVVSARIHILARSIRPSPVYVNTKTYNMANTGAYTPNDNFYRRIISTTVMIRNVQGTNLLNFN
jgi:type IV pilus assembly protein PilW